LRLRNRLVDDYVFGYVVGADDRRETWSMLHAVMRDERRFERGLQRLLDGIERSLEPRSGA
jgi:hypothetical protein